MNEKFACYPSLKDKIVIITGGATGIGRAFVEQFDAQEAEVHFLDTDAEASVAFAEQTGAMFHLCDVTDISRLQCTINQIAKDTGGIDVLISNAANDTRHGLEEVSPENWDACMAVNLKHQFFATQAVIPHMEARGGGTIICLGSIAWLNNTTDMIGYTTAKAAIHGLVRTLARQLGPKNIRVNALLPGWTITERQKDLWIDDAAKAEIKIAQCLPGYVMPDDVARMALFLSSDDAAMCTQQSFVVDGGWV